jgi:hypothetical protein
VWRLVMGEEKSKGLRGKDFTFPNEGLPEYRPDASAIFSRRLPSSVSGKVSLLRGGRRKTGHLSDDCCERLCSLESVLCLALMVPVSGTGLVILRVVSEPLDRKHETRSL